MENFKLKKELFTTMTDLKKQKILFYSLVVFNLVIALVLILSPVTSIKGSEPNVAYTIQVTMQNPQMMYQDPEAIPFAATQYTPLYYIVCSTFGNLLSLSLGDNVVLIYNLSRAISFLASLISLYFIFLLLTKICNISKHWSFWIASASIISTIPWFFAVRPDSLMAMFFIISVYYFCRYSYAKVDSISLILSGAFAIFSFFSKQNGLLIVLIGSSYLLLNFKWKDFVIYLTGVLIGSLVLGLIFTPFYNEFFLKNIIQGVNNGIDFKTAVNVPYFNFTSRYGVITTLAITIAVILFSKKSLAVLPPVFKFIVYLLLALFPFAVITALKIGSDINYFNEVIIFSFVLLAIGLRIMRDDYLPSITEAVQLLFFILIFSFSVSASVTGFLEVGLRNLKRITEVDEVYNQPTIMFLKSQEKKISSPFYILADEAFIHNALPLNSILPQPDISLLWKLRGIYDFNQLDKAINNGTVLFYVGNGAMLKFFNIGLESNFQHVKTIDGNMIYKNKHAAVRLK